MMICQCAGSIAVGAYFPTESELHRKVKQLIAAARRYMEGVLCKSTRRH